MRTHPQVVDGLCYNRAVRATAPEFLAVENERMTSKKRPT